MYIHNFWCCLGAWRNIIKLKNSGVEEFCCLCLEDSCDCNQQKVGYQDALDIATWMADINLTLGYQDGVVISIPYDGEYIYPYFRPKKGKMQHGANLVYCARVEPMVASVVKGTTHYNIIGDNVEPGSFGDPYVEGITWGYMAESFVPTATYNFPHWSIYPAESGVDTFLVASGVRNYDLYHI